MHRLARVIIHSDPIAVRVPDDLRATLTSSLIETSARDDTREHLDVFWGAVKGLGPTRHENYASIEQAIDDLRISEADVLGL